MDRRTNGIHTGITLPPSIVTGIRKFEERRMCYANFDPSRPFLPAAHREAERIAGKPIRTGQYPDTVEERGAVEQIRSDAGVIAVAEEYLNATMLVRAVGVFAAKRDRAARIRDAMTRRILRVGRQGRSEVRALGDRPQRYYRD
jgi:hypothetical protein